MDHFGSIVIDRSNCHELLWPVLILRHSIENSSGIVDFLYLKDCVFCLAHSGYYWIDPNEGCISDAEYIYCDFEHKRACVDPKKENVRLPLTDHIYYTCTSQAKDRQNELNFLFHHRSQ